MRFAQFVFTAITFFALWAPLAFAVTAATGPACITLIQGHPLTEDIYRSFFRNEEQVFYSIIPPALSFKAEDGIVYRVPIKIAYIDLSNKDIQAFFKKAGIYPDPSNPEYYIVPNAETLSERLGLGPGKSELWFATSPEGQIDDIVFWRALSQGKVLVGMARQAIFVHDVLFHGVTIERLAKDPMIKELKVEMQKAFEIYDNPKTPAQTKKDAWNFIRMSAQLIESANFNPEKAILNIRNRRNPDYWAKELMQPDLKIEYVQSILRFIQTSIL